jgi:hypothetical protein
MSGTKTLLDQIEIQLGTLNNLLSVYIDVWDNSLSRKWLAALNKLIDNNYHLEKNYCFFGFADSARNGNYLIEQINKSIDAINNANLGYHIDDYFSLPGTIDSDLKLIHKRFNRLHRYFEDLQGVSGNMSPYYVKADDCTRWHIRQLNLLCHEFESWALSWRKKHTDPEWQRPSQLMCWLTAPRFDLSVEDYELFGIETINRTLGGVYVGVNKAIGKHHWEVFQDEGRDSRVGELTTTTMRSQTEAAGDFDIEWANNPGKYHWQIKQLAEFKIWLIDNGFDPDDKSLTIGHPQVGQVNLEKSFNTTNYTSVWQQLANRLNVVGIKTSDSSAIYNYDWSDDDYMEQQIAALQQGK